MTYYIYQNSNLINACNGFYYDAVTPNKPYKPTMWTEAWNGWFAEFDGPIYQRPVQDLAYCALIYFIPSHRFHSPLSFLSLQKAKNLKICLALRISSVRILVPSTARRLSHWKGSSGSF
ncbi:Beta-galactosidase [Bertholletia excelsa]